MTKHNKTKIRINLQNQKTKPLKYGTLELFLSQPRLNRYLRACGNSKSKALQLYRVNLRVSQAFYPVLNLFEIFLRNTLCNQLALFFNDSDWIIHQKNGFMTSDSLTRTKFYLRNAVHGAEYKLKKTSTSVSSSKIIAEQTLGFWSSFFDPHHFRLIGGVAIKGFPNKPPHVNRKTLAIKLKAIREFRNRVYHNEPICFRGHHIDFSTASAIRSDLLEIIRWIEPELVNYIGYYDTIEGKIKSKII